MFFLVCCFIRLLACSKVASVSFLLAGAALKFFPIFACLSFLRLERSDALRATTAVGLLFLVYLGLCWQDLPQIFSSTLKGVTIYSYGVRSHWLDIPLTNSLIPAIAITIAVVFVFFSQTGGSLLSKELATGNFLDSFRAGAGIYVGTFVLGNNWAYRLVFLFLSSHNSSNGLRTGVTSRLLCVLLRLLYFLCGLFRSKIFLGVARWMR